jgi:hypothetical protein
VHQTADTSFLARRGLVWEVGFVLRLDLAFGFGEVFCSDVVGDLLVAVTLSAGIDLGLVERLVEELLVAASLVARASLRKRLLRWSLFSLGFMSWRVFWSA